MPDLNKPSSNEEEYFLRQEAEKRRKQAEEARARMEQQERERRRELHYMKCPKCGMDLHEVDMGEVRVDKCFSCEGLWLDSGELERLTRKQGVLGRITRVFHNPSKT